MKASNRFINEGFVNETPSGTVNGVNATFTLSFAPNEPVSVSVFLNGILQRETTDYTLTGTSLVFVTAPALGQDVRTTYIKST